MSQANERRREFVPILARAFAEMGYRRATTAELARRCDVQETILYRLWPEKKAMFIAAIEYVYDLSTKKWEELLAVEGDGMTAAERILQYEAEHHGEFGLYRVLFAGLSEADDDEIQQALFRMYGRYQAFVERRVLDHRKTKAGKADRNAGVAPADLTAWAIVGMGTVTSIARELGLLSPKNRKRLWEQVGRVLLEGRKK
ncbi:MAG: TetR/AcrR family transcriptional regulator [Planctomycetota bacterium]